MAVIPIKVIGHSARTGPVRPAPRSAYDRLFADFKNYKRHAERDLAEAKASGRDELVRALIPVLADLDAASRADGDDVEAVRRGVRMIRLKLDDVLAQAGYGRVGTTQCRMDPRVHEAIAVIPVRGVEDGRILEELSPGYTRDGQLVQPARITVAKGDSTHAGEAEGPASGQGNRRDGRMAGAGFEADGG